MTKAFLIIALLIGLGVSAQDSLHTVLSKFNKETIPYISVEELKMLQTHRDFLLLDARERKEFEVSKIEGAIHAGYNQFLIRQFSNFVTDKNQLIIVYCSLGIRSEDIGEKLKEAGYTNVKNLYGGIFEWKNKNLPVFNQQGNETQKVHAYSKKWGKWLEKGEKVY